MVDRDRVRRSYDELADAYAAQRSKDGQDVAILGEFVKSLPARPRVLDAGCGQGAPVLRRLSESTQAVGLDFSRGQLDLATDNAPGVPLVQGDMTALPFEAGAFDAVVAYHSLIHVPIDEHPDVLAEFARVLRPGARLLLSEGRESWRGTNPDWLDTGTEMQWDIAGPDATGEHLRNAGFEVVEKWGAPDSLDDDDEGADPFFAARLRE